MSDQNAEPTMEEILASIRRIIAEEDEPASVAPPPERAAAGTQAMPVAPAPRREPEGRPARAPEPAPLPAPEDESLVSPSVAAETASAFGQLTHRAPPPRDSHPLEDVVREMLNPLLKAWLDKHLPAIVQARVAEEVQRIARRGVG